MAKTKFYNTMDGKHPLSRKQKALYNYLLPFINKEVILLISKDDDRDDNILDVVNGDSFLELNQNGLAVCDTFENENGIEYYVICFYDTSDVKEYEKTTWDISRHPEKGENFDGLDYSDLIIIDDKGNLLKCSQNTSLFESKTSSRKSIKESLNFKKDYAVEVMGTDWLRPFYWDFNEFRDDLLIASEEYGFTYYITEATTTEYRINIKLNDNLNMNYEIKFRLVSKTDKTTAKELNDYLN